MPAIAREQPEHLRDYFMERLRYYREQSVQLPRFRSALSGNGRAERQKVVLIFHYQPAIIMSSEPEQLR
ncbi:TPA: hypothetical protein MIQ63_000490 [Klebsiella aerogenes]|nr:hypothetical protein [Klebsiella aerogenes]HBY1644243.1 hypothetical protein [Klebsiella aerogenes]